MQAIITINNNILNTSKNNIFSSNKTNKQNIMSKNIIQFNYRVIKNTNVRTINTNSVIIT